MTKAVRARSCLSIASNRAGAQAWPTHPVRLIVPFAAGGPTDVIARIVGERLSKTWGQQVLIENRPGGGTWPLKPHRLKPEPSMSPRMPPGSRSSKRRFSRFLPASMTTKSMRCPRRYNARLRLGRRAYNSVVIR
jgi:hypothetical protein